MSISLPLKIVNFDTEIKIDHFQAFRDFVIFERKNGPSTHCDYVDRLEFDPGIDRGTRFVSRLKSKIENKGKSFYSHNGKHPVESIFNGPDIFLSFTTT